MSEPNVQKNRYLRLDGSPIEHGQAERLFPKGTLSATFLAAVAAHIPFDPTSFDAWATPILGATSGFIARRISLAMAFNSLDPTEGHDFNNHVIDMHPHPGTPNSKPKNYALNVVSCILTNTSITALGLYKYTSTFNIPISIPLTIETAYQIRTLWKIRTGQWKIIKRADMEHALEPQTKPATTAALAASPG